MRKYRSSILLAILMTALCGAIILGSTLAYFTSEEQTGENIIAASNLEVGFDWASALPADESGWQNAADNTLFNEAHWEPNHAAMRYIRIRNGGNLAFQYELNVLPTMVVEGGPELMDVIDVYFGIVDDTTPAITRSNFAQQLTRMGTMTELLSNEHGAAFGILLPKGATADGINAQEGSVTACMVLHMQQEAGNEYMGLSAGEGFKLQLAATQYNYLPDAFGQVQNPTLPDVGGYGTEVIQPVQPSAGGVLAADVNFTSSTGVTATVPAGAQLEAGAAQLKLIVTPKAQSEANVTLAENEVLDAWEVTVEGLSKENTTPVRIAMGKVLPKALNIGNYKLYHVENGTANLMTLVPEVDAASAHNSYSYDPATGEVVVAMATFSEVDVVADTVNAWKGVLDNSWYTDESATSYTIYNADQLAYFGKKVAEGTTFENNSVTLASDINLGAGTETYADGSKVIFYSIGTSVDYKQGTSPKAFAGTFDGAGHIITGLYQNGWEMGGNYDNGYFKNAMGLFGLVENGTVQNLTLDNFEMVMEFAPMGCVTAYVDGKCTFKNIAVFNSHPQTYNTAVAGIAGWDRGTSNLIFENITVDNSNMISALWGTYDCCAGGILGYLGEDSYAQLTNCHVAAQLDVYNDACANYQYYWYRYCGMLIGTVDGTVKDANGYTIPDISQITIEGCSVDYGNWNNYKYCEFETLGKGSYNGPGEWKFCRTDDSRCAAGHTHADYESHEVLLPFNQLFGGYGWGVKGIESHEKVVVTTNMQSVKKFEVGIDKLTVGKEYRLSDLFDVIPDKNVVDAAVQLGITVSEANGAKYEYVQMDNPVNWRDSTLKFTEVGDGKVHLTIQDYYYCIPTSVDIELIDKQPVEKFETKFTGDFLYRVGNQNAVKLESLFKAKEGVEIDTVSVTVEAVEGTVATGTYTRNATWTNGIIQFSGTGVVKVTIGDNDPYCKPTELILEVVDAVNATAATSATSNNVVLLNDINGGFTVSGRYAVYGNGFTLKYTGNGQYLNNGLKQGIVTVTENGILDNLRIEASIYPNAYLYYSSAAIGSAVKDGPSSVEGDKTRYHYQLSAIAASGNATITNCYIYGGRNNIFVNTGDVIIKNTVLECGTVANVQIQSNGSHTITFEDVTTIQYQMRPTIGDTSKVILGAGVLVGPETTENPAIVLKGDFKQYNWVNADDKNAVSDEAAKKIIESALNVTEYNHTVNGKTASNLGIIFMNEYPVSVTNKTELPYQFETVSISGVGGQVYSPKNASDGQIYSDVENTDRSTVNDLYQPQFKYSPDLGGQYIEKNDDGDEHCYREGDTIHVMFPAGDTKELDLASLVSIDKYTAQDLKLNISCNSGDNSNVPVNDGKVVLSAADVYNVTYTVTDALFYDNNGNRIDRTSIGYQWKVMLDVALKDNAVPNARFEFDATKQKMGYYKPGWGDVKQYLPFLEGLKIFDYNGQNEYLRFEGSSDFKKIASITIEYVGKKASVEIKLTDGGVINTQFLARANSNGGSTYTGKIKTKNETVYFVTDSGTKNLEDTTTAAYWYVDYYRFTGNNGVTIQSAQQTFNSTGSSASTPSGSFSTSIKYTVSYDANGGNCGQSVGYATSVSENVSLPTPKRSGYIFNGWYTAAAGGNRVGGAEEKYKPETDITLYAQWGRPSTVTYNANGGSCSTATEKYTGNALTLPVASREGYWFVGWYDAASDGNKIGEAGASYIPQNDITLYAHWQEKIEYTVTYNANGGECGTSSATYQGTALTLPTPTRTGYKFLGWYTAASGGTNIGDAGESYTPSANITLYAQWEQMSYTITISKQDNATVTVDKTTAHYNDTISVTVSFSENNSKTLTVKDIDGNTVLSKSAAGTYTFKMPASNVDIEASSSGGCVTPDTLVTLADGSKKEIQHLTYSDQFIVWNFYDGCFEYVPASALVNHGYDQYRILSLVFSDGTVVKTIEEHGFYDIDDNRFVFINEGNAAEYVGRNFAKLNHNNSIVPVELIDYNVAEEYTGSYSILSDSYNNVFVENMLSLTPLPGVNSQAFFDALVIGDNMKYDADQLASDIEQYGLYEYSDFSEYVTPEQFKTVNGAFLKIIIGKGGATFEEVLDMIRTYVP
ncbi:MAG: hypothetical protein E7320_02990 [Clostridiales bacterium]|nr:hypothetical protein [Clostridiales bacterium]